MARPDPVETPVCPVPGRRGGRLFARHLIDAKALAVDTGNTILLFDEIGYNGIRADDFLRQLSAMSGPVNIRINSPGGDIDQGIGIFNALVRYPAKVSAFIDGVAASAASVISMAADEIVICDNAFSMLHRVWGATIGNTEDHASQAKVLAQFDQSLIGIYSARTGQAPATISRMMAAETWLDASSAKRLGFATSISQSARPNARFDLSSYQNVPEQLAAPLGAPTHTYFHSRTDLEKALREKLQVSNGFATKLARGGFAAIAGDQSTQIDDLDSRVAEATREIHILRNNHVGHFNS